VSQSIELRAIGRGTAHDVMRGLLWLIRAAGYSGLVLCIDEVEELAKLGTRKRRDQLWGEFWGLSPRPAIS
jgi:hypothetical protein